jgi:hypothetical protein
LEIGHDNFIKYSNKLITWNSLLKKSSKLNAKKCFD